MYSEDYDNYEDQGNDNESSNSKIMEIYYNNKKPIWILGIIIIFIIIALIFNKSATGGTTDVLKPDNEVEKVQVSHSKDIKIKVRNNRYTSSNDKITWNSQNSLVADVDSNGRLTGKMVGTTKVDITYTENGKPYYASVDVVVFKGNENVILQSASFDDKSLIINTAGSYTLSDKMTVSPDNAYVYDMKYESSNPSVVTVDENGVVKGQSEGKAVITVYVNERKYETKIDVYVRNVKDNEMIKLPQKIEFMEGETLKIPVDSSVKTINLDLSPRDSSTKYITWKSSDENVIAVTEDGKVAALKAGSATITATSINGVSGKILVEGSSDLVTVDSISIVSSINISVNNSYTLNPVVSPDNASNKALIFESSNPSIVTVNPNSTKTAATIYGVKAGTAVITIKSDINNGKTATVTVTVTGSQSPTPGNGEGQSGSIAVRLGDNDAVPDKKCDGIINYYKAPLKVTIRNYSGNANYISYCYTKGCTPNDNKREKLPVTFDIRETGTFILKVRKYTSSSGDNEISSSGSSNYVNGSLVYYINTKSSGLSCTSNSTWESGGSTSSTNTGSGACYVGTSSQGVSKNFTWVPSGGTIGTNSAKTVIQNSVYCNAAKNGNLCFRNGNNYCWGSECSIKSGYIYVPNVTKEGDCTSKELSKDITVPSSPISLKVNEKKNVTITLHNISSAKIEFKDEGIISVNKSSITSTSNIITITGKKAGNAEIKVTEINASGNKITKSFTVTVAASGGKNAVIKCINPTYNGSLQILATCENGVFVSDESGNYSTNLNYIEKQRADKQIVYCKGTNGIVVKKECEIMKKD